MRKKRSYSKSIDRYRASIMKISMNYESYGDLLND